MLLLQQYFPCIVWCIYFLDSFVLQNRLIVSKRNLILLSGLVFFSMLGLLGLREQPVKVLESDQTERIQFESGVFHSGDLLLSQPLMGFQFFAPSGEKGHSLQGTSSFALVQQLQSAFATSRVHHHHWVRLLRVFAFNKLFLKHGVLIQ
jgi:hypothetical protein